jgi:hypothetical protein
MTGDEIQIAREELAKSKVRCEKAKAAYELAKVNATRLAEPNVIARLDEYSQAVDSYSDAATRLSTLINRKYL